MHVGTEILPNKRQKRRPIFKAFFSQPNPRFPCEKITPLDIQIVVTELKIGSVIFKLVSQTANISSLQTHRYPMKAKETRCTKHQTGKVKHEAGNNDTFFVLYTN